MSEFDQVEWEAPYEFPPGPKPMLLEAESPEAGKFGPLHVFAVVPLDAAEKAFEAGVQAEKERIEARIEAKASEIDRAADKYQEDGMRFTESGDHAASMGAFNYETRSRDVAKLIRALAVVTGEGASAECPDCGKSQEGGYGPNEELLCGNDFHDLFPDGDPGSGGQR